MIDIDYFRPMGGKLADEFVKIHNGEYDEELELNPEFLSWEKLEKELDAEFIEIVPQSSVPEDEEQCEEYRESY